MFQCIKGNFESIIGTSLVAKDLKFQDNDCQTECVKFENQATHDQIEFNEVQATHAIAI